MLGPLVNAAAIVVCALAGRFLVKGIPARFEDHLKKAIGVVIVFVGIRGALDNESALLLVASVILGAVAGELLDLDGLMTRLGRWAEGRLARGANGGRAAPGSFSKGFVSASVLFCSGSMAIVGSMQSGLLGIHDILFTKSVLDGAISVIFAASMGIGVAFSAIPVLLYQGGIALASMALAGHLTDGAIREMSAVGSLLVAAIGFNFLGTREIKVANLIPAVFVPLLWLPFGGL